MGAKQKRNHQIPPYPDGCPWVWLDLVETDDLAEGEIYLKSGEMEGIITVNCPKVSKGECGDIIVSLMDVQPTNNEEGEGLACVGELDSTYVAVVGNNPGVLSFLASVVHIPGSSTPSMLEIIVVRQGGCVGSVSCKYTTEKLSAVPGFDYIETDGVLQFGQGVTEQRISIHISPKSHYRVTHDFLVVLTANDEDAGEAVEFNPDEDGGREAAIVTVVIGELEPSKRSLWKSLDRRIVVNCWQKGLQEWPQQFIVACICNGSFQEQAEADCADWFWHLLSLPWRLIFALIPPTTLCGGWLCFYFCLGFIAGLTAILADLAELFGCVLEVPDIITAITFVALGTSMPDLFASKLAATEDPTADASIVNVTGSNSVNVFLGLGLPWTIAALYWNITPISDSWVSRYADVVDTAHAERMFFVVPAGNLGFSIVVFCIASFGAIIILFCRRKTVDGELGGPFCAKVACSATFVLYWAGYVGLVSWRALRYSEASRTEEITILTGVMVLELCITVVPLTMLFRERNKTKEETPSVSDDSFWL